MKKLKSLFEALKPLFSLEYWVLIGFTLFFPGVFIFLGYQLDWYAFSQLEMREVVIGIIAWIALVIGFYRNILFSRQTKTAAKQAEIAVKQADTAAKQTEIAAKQVEIAAKQADTAAKQTDTEVPPHLNDRYKTGTEMLGNSVLSVRIDGIYTLANLADEHPELYHVQVMKLFCFTVRFPPHATSDPDNQADPDNKAEAEDKTEKVREDIQEIMTIVSKRKKERIKDEHDARYRLYLRHANLSGADLSGADLSKADLIGAVLNGVNLSKAKLIRADLMSAQLIKADLSGAILRKTRIISANLSRADLSDVKGLRQKDLDLARADSSYSPILTGAIDPVTKQPLKW